MLIHIFISYIDKDPIKYELETDIPLEVKFSFQIFFFKKKTNSK